MSVDNANPIPTLSTGVASWNWRTGGLLGVTTGPPLPESGIPPKLVEHGQVFSCFSFAPPVGRPAHWPTDWRRRIASRGRTRTGLAALNNYFTLDGESSVPVLYTDWTALAWLLPALPASEWLGFGAAAGVQSDEHRDGGSAFVSVIL